MSDIDPKSTLPWRIGKSESTIVSDHRTTLSEHSGHSAVEYYGGHLVAESVPHEFAKFIVDAANATLHAQ